MKYILFTDSDKEEIRTFSEGIESLADNNCTIYVARSDYGQKNKFINLLRYIKYFFAPFIFFTKRYKCDILLGWQQFYALNLVFFCRLFHTKKRYKIVALNFTYKRKKGLLGTIYHKYMKYCINNDYLDLMHVPSFNYVENCCKELNISPQKFIVRGFGVPDFFEKWIHTKVDCSNYSLSIGRSNRDFDFLLTAWNKIETDNHQLIIISDTYKPKQKLPNNVILKNDIIGEEQFPWIANAELVIIPIKDGTICSGDTVLLNSMMLKKTTVVTTPSTLQEMYIQNGYNGIAIEKDPVVFSRQVSELLINNEKREKIGKQARESFLKNFSRFAMGQFFAQVCAKNFNQQYDDK